LGAALGWEITVVQGEPFGPSGPEPLHFSLDFEPPGRRFRLPLRLRAEDEAGCLALAERLASFPAWRNPRSAAWPVPVTLAAGRMTLPAAEWEALAVSDILLPPDYPAAQGRLALLLANGGELNLSVRSGRAEVIAWNTSEVTTVSDLNQPPESTSTDPPPPETAPPGPAAPEVIITFEGGKKLLPWGDLEALAPGRSFPLEVDPLGPVTLAVNGRALAAGRLVDLGGTLGVEITRLLER
jgi:type III secretion system YscQ/HrcQ family protein